MAGDPVSSLPWSAWIPLPSLCLQGLWVVGTTQGWVGKVSARAGEPAVGRGAGALAYLACGAVLALGYWATWWVARERAQGNHAEGTQGTRVERVGFTLAFTRITLAVAMVALTTRMLVQTARP